MCGKAILFLLVFKEDARWAPRWEARATVSRDRKMWIAEIATPFAELGGAPARAAKWRMNFCRERWIGEPRGPWAPKELSAWSPTFREFGLPARFGTATFRSLQFRGPSGRGTVRSKLRLCRTSFGRSPEPLSIWPKRPESRGQRPANGYPVLGSKGTAHCPKSMAERGPGLA